MTKKRYTITFPMKLREKARKEWGHGNFSGKLEQLARHELDEEKENKLKEDINLLENSGLTEQQKQAVIKLIENGKKEIETRQIWRTKTESWNIYSRKDLKRKAFKSIQKSSKVPYRKKNGGLYWIDMECRCGHKIQHPKSLKKTDGKCSYCDRQIINLDNTKIDEEKDVIKL